MAARLGRAGAAGRSAARGFRARWRGILARRARGGGAAGRPRGAPLSGRRLERRRGVGGRGAMAAGEAVLVEPHLPPGEVAGVLDDGEPGLLGGGAAARAAASVATSGPKRRRITTPQARQAQGSRRVPPTRSTPGRTASPPRAVSEVSEACEVSERSRRTSFCRQLGQVGERKASQARPAPRKTAAASATARALSRGGPGRGAAGPAGPAETPERAAADRR